MNIGLFIGWRYAGGRRSYQNVAFLSRVSIVGLVVGVMLLITVLSIMNGFDRELRQRILGLVPQAAIYHKQGVEDWQALQKKLEQHSDVKAAAPFVELQGMVAKGTEASPVLIYGIDIDQEKRVSRIAEFLPSDIAIQLMNKTDTFVVGRSIATRLSLKVGDTAMLIVPDASGRLGSNNGSPQLAYFTLIHILDTQTELDNTLVLTRLSAAAALSPTPSRISGLRMSLSDLFVARQVVWELVNQVGYGYYGQSWEHSHGNLFHAIQMSKKLVGLLMSLIVAIAAFNVVSTLIMVVVEKQADIAILRTLGTTTGTIMRIFIYQGSLIGLFGTSVGVLAGILLTWCVGPLVHAVERISHVQFLKADVYPLTYLPTQIVWSDVLNVALTALVMSFCATLYPAWRASRARPAEILRYE